MGIAGTICSLRNSAEMVPRPEFPWEERPTFSPPPEADELETFEKAGGFQLPPEVIEFFRETDQVIGMSIHNGYWIGGVSKMTLLAHEDRIPRAIDDQPVLPIATDGGGNLFFVSGAGHVYRWWHDSEESLRVSKSFAAFLQRVAEDWTAFVLDTPGWSYLVE